MGLDVLGGVGGGAVAGVSTGGNTAGNTGTVGNQIVLVGGANITLSEATAAGGLATVSIVGGGGFTEGVSTGGNTAGTTGTVNNGILLYGGANITLSQSSGAGGATVSVVGGAGVGAFQGGVSTGGNTSGNTKTVASQIVFVGGNNVTLSQATNGASATITISGPSGGGAGMSNLGNTAGTSGTVGMELVFVGSRNVSLSQSTNGSSGTLSILGPANVLNSFSIGGNTGTTNSSNITGGGYVLAGGSNITLSQSNNSISIHGASGGTGAAGVTLYQYPPVPYLYLSGQADWSFYSGSTSANGASTHSTMSYYVEPYGIVGDVIASDVAMLMKLTVITGASTGSATVRQYLGLYSLTSDSLSLASSWMGGLLYSVSSASAMTLSAVTGSASNSIASIAGDVTAHVSGTKLLEFARAGTSTIPASQYFLIAGQHYVTNSNGIADLRPIYSTNSYAEVGKSTNSVSSWLALNGIFSSTSSTNVAGANQWLMPPSVATSALTGTNYNIELRPIVLFRGI